MGEERGSKILQIIPAQGWYALCNEGSLDEFCDPLVCWALLESGEIVGQISMGTFVESAEENSNFSRYIHDTERTVVAPAQQFSAEEIASQNREAQAATIELAE